jgi:hypothetical protein
VSRPAWIVGVLVVVFFAAGCTGSSEGTGGSGQPFSPSTGPSPALPHPPTHAINAACVILEVHLNLLAKELNGKAPITDTVEGEFILAAQQLRKHASALAGTQAESDLKHVANDAQRVGSYNDADIGELLDRVDAFASDARGFSKTYCELL